MKSEQNLIIKDVMGITNNLNSYLGGPERDSKKHCEFNYGN